MISFINDFCFSKGTPVPFMSLMATINGIGGYLYGRAYNTNPRQCAIIFSIMSIVRNSIRIIAGCMMAITNCNNELIRADFLLNITTYAITIVTFRIFALIGDRTALILSALAFSSACYYSCSLNVQEFQLQLAMRHNINDLMGL